MIKIIHPRDLSKYILSEFPYHVFIQIDPIDHDFNVRCLVEGKWLCEQYGADALQEKNDGLWVHIEKLRWSHVFDSEEDCGGVRYCFKEERDAMRFKLKWGSLNACR